MKLITGAAFVIVITYSPVLSPSVSKLFIALAIILYVLSSVSLTFSPSFTSSHFKPPSKLYWYFFTPLKAVLPPIENSTSLFVTLPVATSALIVGIDGFSLSK